MNGPFRGGVLDAVVRMGDCSDGRGGGAVLDGLGLHGGPLLLVKVLVVGQGRQVPVSAAVPAWNHDVRSSGNANASSYVAQKCPINISVARRKCAQRPAGKGKVVTYGSKS